MIEETYICQNCVSDNALRVELGERGAPIAVCPICKHSGGLALPTSDERIKQIFRALVRLNFSEWEYNIHIGGDSLESLILESKAIFNLSPDASIDDFEQAFLAMEEEWYPSKDDGISLGGGYWDGGILYGLRAQRDLQVNDVVAACFELNYFDVIPKAKALVDSLREYITSTMPVGTEYIRGRIGSKASFIKEPMMSYEGPIRHYLPYTGSEIDRPPLTKATEGRMNRPRVSVLYLATDVKTAVSELRPHPGHLVSTAKFRSKREILVANFTSPDIRHFLDDERLEVLRTILSFSDVLNMPVQPEQKELYAVTQLFSDAIRESGFEAVTFKSSLGPGTNLTCFASDAFELVPDSESVYGVGSLNYEIAERRQMPKSFKSDEFKEIKEGPLSSLMHGLESYIRTKK